MQPQHHSTAFFKVLGMAALGLLFIVFAGPIAVVLGLALVGYLAYGLFRLIVRGGPVTLGALTEGAADFCRKLLNGLGWIGGGAYRAVAFVIRLPIRVVSGLAHGVARLGTLALGGALGGLLGAGVWSLYSFDPATIVAGGVFGAIVGTVADLGSSRSRRAVAVKQQGNA